METSTPTRDRIIQILRQSRGSTLADLRHELGLSPSALRQQLIILERDGFVHKSLLRGRSGRPPIVYQPADAARSVSDSFTVLLAAVFKTVAAQAPERFAQVIEDLANRLAVQHGQIAQIPDVEARIRAALGVLFDATAGADVTGDGRQYEVILRACALIPVAKEFPGLCAVTRQLLGTLVGADVTQLESIVRGDARCLFRLVLPDGHRPGD